MAYLSQWIRDLAVFFVIAMMITKILPYGSYVKYLRLFIGMLLMILLLQPIQKLFSSEDFLLEAFEAGIDSISTDGLKSQIAQAEEEQMQQMLDVSADAMIAELNPHLEKINYAIQDISMQRNNAGEYKFIFFVTEQVPEAVEDEESGIHINIPVISIFQDTADESDETDTDAIREIKNIICDFYTLQRDNINIVIQN